MLNLPPQPCNIDFFKMAIDSSFLCKLRKQCKLIVFYDKPLSFHDMVFPAISSASGVVNQSTILGFLWFPCDSFFDVFARSHTAIKIAVDCRFYSDFGHDWSLLLERRNFAVPAWSSVWHCCVVPEDDPPGLCALARYQAGMDNYKQDILRVGCQKLCNEH